MPRYAVAAQDLAMRRSARVGRVLASFYRCIDQMSVLCSDNL
jgi:hypothetical protein